MVFFLRVHSPHTYLTRLRYTAENNNSPSNYSQAVRGEAHVVLLSALEMLYDRPLTHLRTVCRKKNFSLSSVMVMANGRVQALADRPSATRESVALVPSDSLVYAVRNWTTSTLPPHIACPPGQWLFVDAGVCSLITAWRISFVNRRIRREKVILPNSTWQSLRGGRFYVGSPRPESIMEIERIDLSARQDHQWEQLIGFKFAVDGPRSENSARRKQRALDTIDRKLFDMNLPGFKRIVVGHWSSVSSDVIRCHDGSAEAGSILKRLAVRYPVSVVDETDTTRCCSRCSQVLCPRREYACGHQATNCQKTGTLSQFRRKIRNWKKHLNRKRNREKVLLARSVHIPPWNLPENVPVPPILVSEWVAPFLSCDPYEEMAVLVEALALPDSALGQPSTSRFLCLARLDYLMKTVLGSVGRWLHRAHLIPNRHRLRDVLKIRLIEKRSVRYCPSCRVTVSRDGDAAISIAKRFCNLF